MQEQGNTIQPLELAEAIQYQSDSVVSQTLVDKPTGTLTLFAFDTGQGLSEHTSPYDAVVQVLDGEVQLTIGGQELSVGSGNLVVMPANTPHALRAEQRFKMLLIMIRS